MIKITNLCKKFGDTVAVKNLNLEIQDGEFFAFVGPNGAGKTTTLKLLAGLLKPTSGKALINNHDIQGDYVEAKKLISFIPDQPFLYEKLTGSEFLHFVGGLYELNKDTISKRREDLFEMFALTDYADRLIDDYSHGMRQKLVFCAAFLHEPRIMIIDEPMVGLDPYSIKLVKKLLKERASQGVSIFLSTHTLSIAEEIADRIGVIHKGDLIYLGTMEEIKKKKSAESDNLEDIFLQITSEEVL